jgi:DnaJ-domain-containing protein 1
MRQYHPDRVATLGPELQAMAEEKAKQINCAYETLRGRR